MASQDITPVGRDSAKASLLYDPKFRGYIFQAVTVLVLAGLVYWIVNNTIANLQRANLASGFGFLDGRAGFDISSSPYLSYTSDSTFIKALAVGILNTLTVAVVGIITATVIGFIIGIGRLSHNWLIRKLCTVYVEVFRNIPPLLVIFFWYLGVLSVLPQARESIKLPFSTFLNNRGLFFPAPVFGEGAWLAGAGLIAGIVGALLVRRWAYKRQMATGQQFPVGLTALGLIVGLPLLALIVKGFPISFDYPVLGAFNLRGGTLIGPEFMSLYLALSFYYRVLHCRDRPCGYSRCRQGAERGVPCTWPAGGADNAAGRSAAGDAYHHPAAHEPIPQPHQELVPGSRDRLS